MRKGKIEKIYLDQAGYEKFLTEIEALKQQLQSIDKGRKDAFDAGAGDGWDSPEFEEIERNSHMISSEINRRMLQLQYIEIVERREDTSLVDLNDVLRLNIIFDEDDQEEMIVRLVGSASAQVTDGIREVSINSPLGTSIYGKQIGEKTFYKVKDGVINVDILEKMDLQKDQLDGPTKKLVK